MDLFYHEPQGAGCIRRSSSLCAQRCRPYPINESQPGSRIPCCQPAQHQHTLVYADFLGQQPCPKQWSNMPAAYCLTQQQPVLVQAPYLQALTRLACPASLMSVAIDMCARSLGDTMEALQAVSQLCAICPEAAATDSALSHAEQLMAGTIKKIRLTLRLAFLIKQQQQYKQLQQQQGPQGYVYEKEAAAVLPVAVAQWDPSTADSACSGYARLASLQYYAPVTEAASCMLLPVEQQSQQRQEVAKLAHQDAGLQEEVASSWE